MSLSSGLWKMHQHLLDTFTGNSQTLHPCDSVGGIGSCHLMFHAAPALETEKFSNACSMCMAGKSRRERMAVCGSKWNAFQGFHELRQKVCCFLHRAGKKSERSGSLGLSSSLDRSHRNRIACRVDQRVLRAQVSWGDQGHGFLEPLTGVEIGQMQALKGSPPSLDARRAEDPSSQKSLRGSMASKASGSPSISV